MAAFARNDNVAEVKQPGRAFSRVVVRPMKTIDIGQVVNIHVSGFPLSRSTLLGQSFLCKMYEWYVHCQPQLSFVAVLDEEIVGFVAGTYGWGGGRRRFRFTFWQIFQGFLSRPSLLFSAEMFENGANFLRGLFSRKHEGVAAPGGQPGRKAALDSIAVHPAARGVHAGALLMAAFEQAAWSQGADYASLGVESDNHHARRMYERCGWALVHEDRTKNIASYRKFVR
ncbi:MAG: GNAT family N-acetyltransferase [Anaerolineaceae bacterium]|jgi:ribosomal protein S18 acetylase RimI-like enzyme